MSPVFSLFLPICSDQHEQPPSLFCMYMVSCLEMTWDCHDWEGLWWTSEEAAAKYMKGGSRQLLRLRSMISQHFKTYLLKEYVLCLSRLVSGNGMWCFLPYLPGFFCIDGVCLQSEESGRLFNTHLKSATLIYDSNWIASHNIQGYREVKRRAVAQKGEV